MLPAKFERYAVYYTPQGALAKAGAAWLGWDVSRGRAVAHPDCEAFDLSQITKQPRKYGMHGTLKPPLFLAEGTDATGLRQAVHRLADTLGTVTLEGLEIAALGPFLALKPVGDQRALGRLAAEVVTRLDTFRAPPSEAELLRRRQARLSSAQEQHLRDWGYPYVLDQFRFHITLTGRLSRAAEMPVRAYANAHFAPYFDAPFVVDSLTLAGQGSDGMFYEIERVKLKGDLD